ncbi:MAG: 3-phosphoshikimate 1-carboxyvinyltransferase [Butyricicoccus pullicaecorum]|nr:3-phosphoshikimate 1-carboxyvinyltransferase [Butyricicoccus pullicaecorum]
MKINQSAGLHGIITVPGDKSISHRAIMLGALADGTTRITGFLMGEDCLSTIDCFRKMGVEIEVGEREVLVHGVGLHGLKQPTEPLYTGNSGTTTRLLCGILAGQRFEVQLSGDASIQKRPMGRVITPLREMGAKIEGIQGNYCPLTMYPSTQLHGITYELPVASAQLKSAILLAGLYASGQTCVVEPAPSRDHTERMLRALGVSVETDGNVISLTPPARLTAKDVTVPSDISSAAFFLVAGAIVPNSELTIQNVGVNPTRTGILDVLRDMGADITISNYRDDVEPICDLTVRSSKLHGTTIGGDVIPRLIDELPVLAVAAAFAEGQTVIRDAQELKVKESNRIAAMVSELSKAGAAVSETEDGMVIDGGKPLHGAAFETYNDHRIAMSMAVCALGCTGQSEILHPDVVAISYPDFFDTLSTLGE